MSNFARLKKNVTSLDLSKRLKARDFLQESLFYWRTYKGKNQLIQLCLKADGGELLMLWGDKFPKNLNKLKLKIYSAYTSYEVSELLREYGLKIVTHTHLKGKKSPYICYVMKDGKEDHDYPHILDNSEAEAKGLMLRMLYDKNNYL